MFDLPLAKKPRLRLHLDEKFLLGHCGSVRHILKITDRLYSAPISSGAYDSSQKDDCSSYEKHPTCPFAARVNRGFVRSDDCQTQQKSNCS